MSAVPRFGRRAATDDKHLRKWSLTAETFPTLPTPIVLGSDWYDAWSRPYVDAKGNAWLVRDDDPLSWGQIVGGHAYCLNPIGVEYSRRWQRHYDQQRNDCTAYSASIMMSLLNRKTYWPNPIYDYTRQHDEFPGEADEGTSVRATMDTLRDMGEMLNTSREWSLPDGIAANRWCRNISEMAAVLDPLHDGLIVLKRGYVMFRQSWGPDFPYAVRIPLSVVQHVIFDAGGDCTLVTDR